MIKVQTRVRLFKPIAKALIFKADFAPVTFLRPPSVAAGQGAPRTLCF